MESIAYAFTCLNHPGIATRWSGHLSRSKCGADGYLILALQLTLLVALDLPLRYSYDPSRLGASISRQGGSNFSQAPCPDFKLIHFSIAVRECLLHPQVFRRLQAWGSTPFDLWSRVGIYKRYMSMARNIGLSSAKQTFSVSSYLQASTMAEMRSFLIYHIPFQPSRPTL